jgi:hypothetical protein
MSGVAARPNAIDVRKWVVIVQGIVFFMFGKLISGGQRFRTATNRTQ